MGDEVEKVDHRVRCVIYITESVTSGAPDLEARSPCSILLATSSFTAGARHVGIGFVFSDACRGSGHLTGNSFRKSRSRFVARSGNWVRIFKSAGGRASPRSSVHLAGGVRFAKTESGCGNAAQSLGPPVCRGASEEVKSKLTHLYSVI